MEKTLYHICSFFPTSGLVVSLLPSALKLHKSTYSPVHPERIRLNAVLVGDMHTDGDVFRDRNNVLRRSLGAISHSKNPIDAFVIAGDITNAGAEIEYRNLNRMFKYLDKSKQIIPQLGNHDSGGTSEDKTFDNECVLFQQFCKKHSIETENNYFCKTVNDYYFIVMGTEKMLENEAYISDTQLEWLDSTLTLAQSKNKPIFVICHQPLYKTNGVGDIGSDGGLGEQSSQVEQIIKKHTDDGMTVLFVSGHLHASFSPCSFENISKGFYCLNLPSVLYSDGGGCGVIMEIHDEMVLLREYNFLKKQQENCHTIPLLVG